MVTAFKVAAALIAILSIASTGAAAQTRSFVLSPEYAGSLEDVGGSPRWGWTVKTFTARLDFRSGRRVSPWIATGFAILDPDCTGPGCIENGWLLVPGVRVDAVRGRAIRAYVIAGAGAVVRYQGTVELLPSAGVGIRWADQGLVAPRLEIRWERYGGGDYAMLGLGLGFIFGSPVSAYR